MARKKKPEEHENHERYLVSYADLMTLLTALFIILFAMSDVNEQKYNELARSLSVAFHQGSDDIINIDIGQNPEIRKPTETSQGELNMMKAVKEQNELREIKKKIDQKIEDEKLVGKIETILAKDGLKIVLTNEVLFNSGSAVLKKDFKEMIGTIGYLIEGIDNPVEVSGYTDNIPISTARYPSNWELSSDRALSVLKYMMKTNKTLDPVRFSASGFGEYRPIASNETRVGREKNRRVEILVERRHGNGMLTDKEVQ